MRHVRVWGMVLGLVAALACGKSEAEKRAEEAAVEAQKAADAASKVAEQAGGDVAKGMQDFAKAMEGMAGAMAGRGADGKPVDPVGFRELQTVLPEVAGWKMEKPTGERMTSPVSFSQAEVRYANGDADVEVKVVDSAFHQMLIAPWSMFLAAGYEKETSNGYEKSVMVGGHPGFEKWNSESKDGELNLVVAKRFLVTIEGSDIADAKVLHDFAAKMDTAKLATLK
ncbi:MAG: hypothetical protein LC791_08590 [Acidobacteria bacterium]|nr:hypothetical protein [Acidobacteriota bacterium]